MRYVRNVSLALAILFGTSVALQYFFVDRFCQSGPTTNAKSTSPSVDTVAPLPQRAEASPNSSPARDPCRLNHSGLSLELLLKIALTASLLAFITSAAVFEVQKRRTAIYDSSTIHKE